MYGYGNRLSRMNYADLEFLVLGKYQVVRLQVIAT